MSTFRFQATVDVVADSQEDADNLLKAWMTQDPLTLNDALRAVDDHGGFEMVEEWPGEIV